MIIIARLMHSCNTLQSLQHTYTVLLFQCICQNILYSKIHYFEPCSSNNSASSTILTTLTSTNLTTAIILVSTDRDAQA